MNALHNDLKISRLASILSTIRLIEPMKIIESDTLISGNSSKFCFNFDFVCINVLLIETRYNIIDKQSLCTENFQILLLVVSRVDSR